LGRKRHLKDERRPEEHLAAERLAAALKALNEYKKVGSLQTGRTEVIDVLRSESDRGAIILVAGVLEDVLASLILVRLPLGNARKEDLLRRGGALNQFQDKVAIGRAMGIVDDEMAESFDIIRALRNACAHSVREMTLQTPAIHDVFALLFDNRDQLKGYDAGQQRTMLGFVMVFYVERMLGKSREQAHAIVEEMMEKIRQDSEKR
jgi:hypothetical protein